MGHTSCALDGVPGREWRVDGLGRSCGLCYRSSLRSDGSSHSVVFGALTFASPEPRAAGRRSCDRHSSNDVPCLAETLGKEPEECERYTDPRTLDKLATVVVETRCRFPCKPTAGSQQKVLRAAEKTTMVIAKFGSSLFLSDRNKMGLSC